MSGGGKQVDLLEPTPPTPQFEAAPGDQEQTLAPTVKPNAIFRRGPGGHAGRRPVMPPNGAGTSPDPGPGPSTRRDDLQAAFGNARVAAAYTSGANVGSSGKTTDAIAEEKATVAKKPAITHPDLKTSVPSVPAVAAGKPAPLDKGGGNKSDQIQAAPVTGASAPVVAAAKVPAGTGSAIADTGGAEGSVEIAPESAPAPLPKTLPANVPVLVQPIPLPIVEPGPEPAHAGDALSYADEDRFQTGELAAAFLQQSFVLRKQLLEDADAAIRDARALFGQQRLEAQQATAAAIASAKGAYRAARAELRGLFASGDAAIAADVAAAREQALAFERAETGRLAAAGQAAPAAIQASAARYDPGALAIGEAEALRLTGDSEQQARAATALGEWHAGAATGNAEVRKEKAEGFRALASQVAAHIRETGAQGAAKARQSTADARGMFDGQAQPLVLSVASLAATAVARLPLLSKPVLDRQVALKAATQHQFAAASTAALAALSIAEHRAVGALNAGLATFTALADDAEQKTTSAIRARADADVVGLEAHCTEVLKMVEAAAAPDATTAGAILSIAVVQQADRVASSSASLEEGLFALDREAGGFVGAFMKTIAASETAVAGQIEQTVAASAEGVRQTRSSVASQLEREVDSYGKNLTTGVSATVKGFDDTASAMTGEVDKALLDLHSRIAAPVDKTIAENRKDLDQLPGSLAKANTEIDARHQRGFWSKVWDAIVDIVTSIAFWVGMLLLLVVIVIGVIWGSLAALIAGLVLLAFAVVYTTYLRVKSLIDEDAPWYRWAIYIALWPFVSVPDALGLGGLVEGAVGYDIVTGRKLSEDEAAQRMASGIVSVVMILVTLGLSKAVAPRVPVTPKAPFIEPPIKPLIEPPIKPLIEPVPPKPVLPEPKPPLPEPKPPLPEPKPPLPEPKPPLPEPKPPLPEPKPPLPEPKPPLPEPKPPLPEPKPPLPEPKPPLPQPKPPAPKPPEPKPPEPKPPQPKPPKPKPPEPGPLPKVWAKFVAELNEAFRVRLRAFRGNDNLNPTFNKGGEGRIFAAEGKPVALKRWFEARLADMPESISLLERARADVESNPRLADVVEVVKVTEKGPDFIVRDFDPLTIELKDAVGQGQAARGKALGELKAMEQAGKLSDAGKNLLKKLNRSPPSENLHWSQQKGKIIVIDLM